MNLLLDTHVFLWLSADPERLGPPLSLVEDPANELILSAASSWEIAIKYGLGKLLLPEPPDRWLPSRMAAVGAKRVAIEHEHGLMAGTLPHLHRDPFDRMLIAQARLLGLTLLTADPNVAQYTAIDPNHDNWMILIPSASR